MVRKEVETENPQSLRVASLAFTVENEIVLEKAEELKEGDSLVIC